MLQRTFTPIVTLSVTSMACVLISACGGGGSSPGTPVAPVSSWPSAGNYEVVLKPSGASTASPLQASLSLVHASTPDTEYQIDTSAAATQLGMSLTQGQWNVTTGQFTNLQNTAYVDHRNGAIRVTALLANGSRPGQLTTAASNLCSNTQLARNFTRPYASQLVADTAGTDGLCGTSDDGQLLITFSDIGAPSSAVVASANRYLGYLRSPTTGEPTHWLVVWKDSGQTDLWSIDRPLTTVIESGSSASTSQFSSVANLSDLILYTQNGLLKAVRMVNGTPSVSSVSVLSGASGWKLAGNDAANAYAYFSSGASASCTGTWRITSVSRSAPSANTLATGTGSLLGAMVLNGAVYASTCSGSAGSLIKVDTATGAQTVLRAPSSTLYVTSSLSGELAVTGISSTQAWSLNFLDSSGNSLYEAGNAMTYGANQTAYDVSSNTFKGDSVYVVPQTLISSGTGGQLQRWDIASNTMHAVGTLPSATDLGGVVGNKVFMGPLSIGGLIGGTFAVRISSDNQFQTSGSRIYTVLPKTDNSLTQITKQVQ